MKTVKQSYLINSPVEKVWQALIDPKIIDKWGGGSAKMEPKENFEFSIWGGEIHGKNIEVIPSKKLVQDWKEKDWDNFSKVTFNLSVVGDKTKLDLLHEGIPDEKAKDTEEGWKEYYIGPLKDLLEK